MFQDNLLGLLNKILTQRNPFESFPGLNCISGTKITEHLITEIFILYEAVLIHCITRL